VSTSVQLDVSRLRDAVRGTVITADDAGYDEARTPFYGGIDKRPAAIVRVADTDDVRSVVTLAREAGVELAVRSGGHSIAGHCVSEGGIVLDLHDLRAFELDRDAATVWAGTGLTAADYVTQAAEHGLATGFGDAGSVGIGGITLGGGVGFLARKHGLTIDSLVAAELVTADGQVVTVDAESDPDLFWAIRGGGGNFGVATRLRLRLHPVDTVVGGLLILPATPDVVEGIIAEADRAPAELSTIVNVMTAPPMPFLPEEIHGSLIVLAFMTFAGDAAAGGRAVAPFRALAEPLADMVRTMRYPEMYMPEEEGYHPLAASHTGFLDRFGPAIASEIVERTMIPGAMMRVVQIRPLLGAVADVPNDATAYAHRDRRYMVNIAALFLDEGEHSANQAWVDETTAALHGDDRSAYVNFLGDEPDRVRDAYPGATWDRLREIKARVDSDNLFRMNQNIPPAEGRSATT
jgi:FAD/FMN-containing dehydrogenase